VCLSKAGLLEVRVIPGTKLMVAQLVKKFPSFMEPKRSYPCLQQSERNLNNGTATKNTVVFKRTSGFMEFHWFLWWWQFDSEAERPRVFAWEAWQSIQYSLTSCIWQKEISEKPKDNFLTQFYLNFEKHRRKHFLLYYIRNDSCRIVRVDV
jgi:hypothetical protein